MNLAMNTIRLAVNTSVVNKTTDKSALTTNFRNVEMAVPEIEQVIRNGHALLCIELLEDENGNTNRDNAHYKSSQIIPLDFDNCQKVVDEKGNIFKDENGKALKERVPDECYVTLNQTLNNLFVKENALLAYTTCSHKPDHHRYRVLFVLPEPVTNPAQYQHILNAFVWKFRTDKDSAKISQPYYGNSTAEITTIGKQLSNDALQSILDEYKNVVEKDKPKPSSKKTDQATDFPKISLDQIGSMLAAIKRVHPALEYNDWLAMIGSLFQKYSYEEVVDLLQKYYPEIDNNEYWQKYNSGLDRIPFHHFIKFARKCGYTRPITYGAVHFIVLDDTGSIEINQKRLLDFLHLHGYRKYYLPESNLYIFVKITDNIVKEIAPSMIKDFLRAYLETNYEEDENKEQILNQLYCGRYINTEKLEYLLSPVEEFCRDSESNAHLLLSNGFMRVSRLADKITFDYEPYSKLPGLIWEKWRKPYYWTDLLSPSKQYPHRNPPIPHTHRIAAGMFEQFIDHIAACNQDRILGLHTAIGYLMHSHKKPSLSKAIILCDETISDHPSGGTGKSLIAQALSYVRNVAFEDGKRFDPSNRFAFQSVTTDTQIVVVDDITRQFSFESLYHLVTGDFEFERKGKDKVKIPYALAPKILLTTNYTVIGNGNSHRRRIAEFEIFPWYGERLSPIEEFGTEFFSLWDEEEWCRFFDFIRICLQEYFQYGLVVPAPKNLEYRKLQQETSSEFVEFFDLRYKVNGEWNVRALESSVTKTSLFEEFCKSYPDFHHLRDSGKFSQRRFSLWVQAYAQYNGLQISEHYTKDSGVSTRSIYFTLPKNVGKSN